MPETGLSEVGSASPQKGRKKWYTNIGILLTILISLVALSMAALMLLLLPQSSEIIRFMQWRMINAKSYYVAADVSYSGGLAQKDALGATRRSDEAVAFSSEGWFDRRDPALPKTSQKFDLAWGKTDPLPFAGDYVRAGAANYFNFSQLPTRLGSLHFEEFRNRWLRVDVKRLLGLLDLPLVGGDHPDLKDEDKAYLLEQFRQTPFVGVDEKLKGEVLGGHPTYHYKVRPEILFFKDYYVLAESRRLGRELTNKERLAADAFFANVTADDGEMWIGTRDYFLYRVRLRFRYDDGERNGVFSFTADFSHFNEPSVMDIPSQDVEDVTQIIESMLPGIKAHLPLAKEGLVPRGTKPGDNTGLPIEVKDAGQDDPDHDGLPNILEKFYGTDPNNPDTDGDGVSDGAEVNAGCSPTGPGRLFSFGMDTDVGSCK